MSVGITISSVSGQSSDNWQTVRDVFQNPDQFSNSRNISAIIEKLERNIQNRCWFDEQRDKERRQAMWLLSIVLFVYGWDNSQNRQRVINIAHKWNIDQTVFYEMKDTAETYRVINSEKDKNDLDKSIKDLIELG
ncbi:MAG: hypothetical protein IJ697_05565 [Synergistaceae bacterium]|nr:hypothetical protein [Synergistaceae bacterium]